MATAFNFLHKVCIVTGAGSGIGRATAVLFAKSQASTVLVARTTKALEDAKSECLSAGAKSDNVLIVKADVCDAQDREKIVKMTFDKFGGINVLVNNAGISRHATMETATVEKYDEVMDINVRAPLFLTQKVLPHLLTTRGCVVNVSSISAFTCLPNRLLYGTSKAALNHFTKLAALELAPKGVRVNAVCPGFVPTGIYNNPIFSPNALAEAMERAKVTHPVGRAGRVEEIAHSIAFLASDESSFITGATLTIDGGRTLIGAM